jgi:hypothetical protein
MAAGQTYLVNAHAAVERSFRRLDAVARSRRSESVPANEHPDLPLARLTVRGGSVRSIGPFAGHKNARRWWWAATCASIEGVDRDAMLDGPAGRVQVGRPRLTWLCLGDPERLHRTLASVKGVGADPSWSGLPTRVSGWAVEDLGPVERDSVLWSGGGLVARPLPSPEAVDALGLGDVDVVDGAYRPLYWRPPPSDTGGFRREWWDVVAPWVGRPSQATA